MDFFERVLGPNKFCIFCNFGCQLKPKSSFKKSDNKIFIISVAHKDFKLLATCIFIVELNGSFDGKCVRVVNLG
jgi:hypothetical protein